MNASAGWSELRLTGCAATRTTSRRVTCLIGTCHDLAPQLAHSHGLQIALENGRQGLWEWFPDDDQIAFSPEWYALFGYPVGHIASLRVDLQAILHPADVASGQAVLLPLLRGEHDTFEIEHRFRHAHGHYLTVLSRGRVVARDTTGRARRIIGTHVDITRLKATERELSESRKLLETVIDALPHRIFWKDLEGKYLGCNRQFARDAGFAEPAELIGKSACDLSWAIDLESIAAEDRRIVTKRTRRLTVERRFHPADGQPIWAETIKAPLENADEDVIAILGVYADVTAHREHALHLQRIADDLAVSEQRLSTAIESGGQCIWTWYPQSDAFEIVGPPFGEFGFVTGTALYERLHVDDRAHQRAALRAFLSGRETTYEYEGRLRMHDGTYRWMLTRASTADRGADGHVQRIVGTLTDISVIKSTQQFLELVLDTVPQAVFWQDRAFRYRGANQRFAHMARMPHPRDLVGLSDDALWWGKAARTLQAEDHRLLDGSVATLHNEHRICDEQGRVGWFEAIKVPMKDSQGNIIGLLGAIHDISARKRAENTAQHLAHYDALTDLPNRRHFSERLQAAVAQASRHRYFGALLFIDLDQFKRINDTCGHGVGDELLKAVARRLRNVTRQEDTVARLGGDEFVVLLPELATKPVDCARQAEHIAKKILRCVGSPFQIEHQQVSVTPTIGISFFPDAAKTVEDVLKEADTAMYSGKSAGRNTIRFFHPEMHEAAQRRLRMEGDIRRALIRNEFALVFQPQVDSAGRIFGAEVLLRWQHPDQGTISPAEFIPIAEESGLIVDIGRWVIDVALANYARWMAEDLIDLPELSINVSSQQFRAVDFVTDVEHLLAVHRIPPQRIVFEITESTVIEDIDTTIKLMNSLRRLGIRFAIDDFGIGYSSLSYLKRLPIDQLKIARSFIADIGLDNNDEVICQTIIAMSQQLRLQTVAEGIETRDQFEFLCRLRCNAYQGYLFLRPSAEAEFIRYCRQANG